MSLKFRGFGILVKIFEDRYLVRTRLCDVHAETLLMAGGVSAMLLLVLPRPPVAPDLFPSLTEYIPLELIGWWP